MFTHLFDFSGYHQLGDIATIFFFLLFAGIVVRVFFLKKTFVTRMSNMPLDSPEADEINDGE